MLVIVTVLFLGVTFYYMNNQVVEIAYMSFSGAIALPLLLLLTLVIGVLLGYLAHFSSSVRLRRDLSGARKELKSVGLANMASKGGSSRSISTESRGL